MNHCSICDLSAEAKYCSNCGQKIEVKEASVLNLIADFFANVISIERSMIGMIWAIFRRPKDIVDNYQKGYRNYYSSPGRMMLYSLTIAVIHLAFVNDELLGLSFDVNNIQPQLAFWLIFLPILIITSYLSFLRVQKKFTRHLISIFYLSSAVFISTVLLVDILELILNVEFKGLQFLLFLLVVFLLNAVVNGRTKWYLVLLNTILQVVVVLVIIALLGGIIYWQSPESIKF